MTRRRRRPAANILFCQVPSVVMYDPCQAVLVPAIVNATTRRTAPMHACASIARAKPVLVTTGDKSAVIRKATVECRGASYFFFTAVWPYGFTVQPRTDCKVKCESSKRESFVEATRSTSDLRAAPSPEARPKTAQLQQR